jgi:energy-coupling factor transporter ATP-binding protein EcfA2
MRVAIIGYSGAGRTTLANALAGVLGTHPIQAVEGLWAQLVGTEPLVLDGIPSTIDELEQIDHKALACHGIDHVLYLLASSEIRPERIARMVAAGTEPARARDRILNPADLKEVRRKLDSAGRLDVLDIGI